MAGQNAPKAKVKTTKELTDEVNNLKNENKIPAEKVKELDEIVKDVVKRLTHPDEQLNRLQEVQNVTIAFKCNNCDQTLHSKKELKEHRKDHHKQEIKCKYCDEIFTENWEMEIHMKNHVEAKKFKCDKCSKEFHLEWRLKKHLQIHLNKDGRKCHYFNNFKTCPFEVIGCQFLHEASEKCYYLSKCSNKLCQFQHNLNQNVEEDQQSGKGFTIVRKKQVLYKCGKCDFRSHDVEVVRSHTTENHKGNKEKVNDDNGDTLEHGDNCDNELTDNENEEDVHDSVTAYLKEYRKKKKESDKVSAGGPRAQSPGFHKL